MCAEGSHPGSSGDPLLPARARVWCVHVTRQWRSAATAAGHRHAGRSVVVTHVRPACPSVGVLRGCPARVITAHHAPDVISQVVLTNHLWHHQAAQRSGAARQVCDPLPLPSAVRWRLPTHGVTLRFPPSGSCHPGSSSQTTSSAASCCLPRALRPPLPHLLCCDCCCLLCGRGVGERRTGVINRH